MSFLPNLAACDGSVRELAGETLLDPSGDGYHWRKSASKGCWKRLVSAILFVRIHRMRSYMTGKV